MLTSRASTRIAEVAFVRFLAASPASVRYTNPICPPEARPLSAEPYTDLDVALGKEAQAGNISDRPDTLGIVHVFRNDLFEITFVKNGISYVVQGLPESATSTLDVLKSWEFI